MAHGECINVERNGPVTTVIIDRPQARNACSVDMVKALHAAFMAFEADDNANCAVLTGVGGAFCAGADLAEINDGSAIGFCWAGTDQGATRRYLSKPVIAGITGPSLAAGLALAIWCDLRVADRDATLGVSCRRFGGPMPNGACVRLPRLIGQSHAMDLMLTGRIIDGVEAYRMGLANRLVEPGTARTEAEALALELANMPSAAMLSDRGAILHQWSLPEEDAIRFEVESGKNAFGKGFQAGAGRFVSGEGRHGENL